MVLAKRIIARLDIKGKQVIKGVCFEGLRVVDSVSNLINKYSTLDIDEYFYSDAVASLYGRNALSDILKESTLNVNIPVTCGGGIRSVEDATNLLASGADKLAINTAAVKNCSIINEIANRFGRQCVVLSIQARRSSRVSSGWEVMIESGRERTGKCVGDWIDNLQNTGIGEVLVTSVDNDGRMQGPDHSLIDFVSQKVKVPLIVAGGFASEKTITNYINKNNISAICLGSALHFDKVDINQIKINLSKKGIVRQNNKISFLKKDNFSRKKISLINYGMGNLESIYNALKNIGHDVKLTQNFDEIDKCDLIVLPGVGSFDNGIRELKSLNLFNKIKDLVKSGKPIIGICLGMQMLFDSSDEGQQTNGLGLLKGEVKSIDKFINYENKSKDLDIKLPHVGWNNLTETEGHIDKFFDKSMFSEYYYFVHTFGIENIDNTDIKSFFEYSSLKALAFIKKENIIGFQFHPERSGLKGIQIINSAINSLTQNI